MSTTPRTDKVAIMLDNGYKMAAVQEIIAMEKELADATGKNERLEDRFERDQQRIAGLEKALKSLTATHGSLQTAMDFNRKERDELKEANKRMELRWDNRQTAEGARETCSQCNHQWSPSLIESSWCIFCILKDAKRQWGEVKQAAKAYLDAASPRQGDGLIAADELASIEAAETKLRSLL